VVGHDGCLGSYAEGNKPDRNSNLKYFKDSCRTVEIRLYVRPICDT
jgi:hypothetical protein